MCTSNSKAKKAFHVFCFGLFGVIAAPSNVHAAQVMDEVWYPHGSIRWAATQTTPDILNGIHQAIDYFSTRTPLELTEVRSGSISQGGLSTPGQMGVLEIRYSEGTFNYQYGGQTKHYRKPNQGRKIVKISFENVKTGPHARNVLAHEMGHVLGFTHEFQRWDRDEHGVKITGGPHLDYAYNYGRPDKKNVRVLSPYDFESRFADGYDKVTPSHSGPATNTLLSKHDINAVYRVYGKPLGNMSADVMYGEAAASADFDGDGIDDIAVAAKYVEPGSDNGAVYFYKGVMQAPGEEGTGTTYVSWFREDIVFGSGQDHKIVLAVGDTHTMSDPKTVSGAGDGISELIVGLPGAERVEVWVINAPGRFGDGLGTFGGHGVGHKITIDAKDVGAAGTEFGASLATGRFFNRNGDDLAIGAPKAGGGTTIRTSARVGTGGLSQMHVPVSTSPKGAAVFLLPNVDPSIALKIQGPANEPESEFGSSLAVMENFDHGHDTLVIGAPRSGSSGEVFVYKRAYYDGSGKAVLPALLDSFSGSTTGAKFGNTLATFTTKEEGGSSNNSEHWIAIGAPKANVSGTKGGEVLLYKLAYSGDRNFEHRISGSGRSEGMNFGQSLAVHRGNCTAKSCPKNQVWIAVGSPRAEINGEKRGRVFLWDVWTDGEVNNTFEEIWDGANNDARFGQDVAVIRGTEAGGGFMALGKKSDLPVLRGTTMSMVKTGSAQVKLNQAGASKWKSWTLGLSPNTAGDTRPSNR